MVQYLNFFIRISRPIPHVKKSALINYWENIFAYWVESWQRDDDDPRCILLHTYTS